jgi:hypothetical protein
MSKRLRATPGKESDAPPRLACPAQHRFTDLLCIVVPSGTQTVEQQLDLRFPADPDVAEEPDFGDLRLWDCPRQLKRRVLQFPWLDVLQDDIPQLCPNISTTETPRLVPELTSGGKRRSDVADLAMVVASQQLDYCDVYRHTTQPRWLRPRENKTKQKLGERRHSSSSVPKKSRGMMRN